MKSAPALLPLSVYNVQPPQPSKALRDATPASYLQRPLPDLPQCEVRNDGRRSSIASEAPSLTPSILQYVDDGSFESDAVELGVTQVVQYTRPIDSVHGIHIDKLSLTTAVELDFSDYDASLPVTEASMSPEPASPGNYIIATGSMLEQQFVPSAFAVQAPARPSIGSDAREALEDNRGTDANFTSRDRRDIGGPEWTRRSPSPVQTAELGSPFSQIWSPRLERKSANYQVNHRRGPEVTSTRELGGLKENTPPQPGNELEARLGNWI